MRAYEREVTSIKMSVTVKNKGITASYDALVVYGQKSLYIRTSAFKIYLVYLLLGEK